MIFFLIYVAVPSDGNGIQKKFEKKIKI